MKQGLFLITVLVIHNLSFSFYGKRGKIERLIHCELKYDANEVYAGNTFDIRLITYFKNGSSECSKGLLSNTVNFLDVNCETTGPADVVVRPSKLKVTVLHDLESEPFITIQLSVKNRKDLSFGFKIPIIYSSHYQLYYQSDPGKAGKNAYVDIWDETVRETDTAGEDGEKGIDGPNIALYVSVVNNGLNGKQIKIVIVPDGYEKEVRYLTPGLGKITVSSIGGRGGNGGNAMSSYDCFRIYGDPLPYKFEAGDGGDGGNGGDVTVYITQEARPYYSQIYIDNLGNMGGLPGNGLTEGAKGTHGSPGNIDIRNWNPIKELRDNTGY